MNRRRRGTSLALLPVARRRSYFETYNASIGGSRSALTKPQLTLHQSVGYQPFTFLSAFPARRPRPGVGASEQPRTRTSCRSPRQYFAYDGGADLVSSGSHARVVQHGTTATSSRRPPDARAVWSPERRRRGLSFGLTQRSRRCASATTTTRATTRRPDHRKRTRPTSASTSMRALSLTRRTTLRVRRRAPRRRSYRDTDAVSRHRQRDADARNRPHWTATGGVSARARHFVDTLRRTGLRRLRPAVAGRPAHAPAAVRRVGASPRSAASVSTCSSSQFDSYRGTVHALDGARPLHERRRGLLLLPVQVRRVDRARSPGMPHDVESAERPRARELLGAPLNRTRRTQMLPGKKYTPDDYAADRVEAPLVHRHPAASSSPRRRPWCRCSCPNRYRASTSILIIPQRVPENFVRSTVTAELSERLNMISQQILSRTRLERIVQEFNLYERERKRHDHGRRDRADAQGHQRQRRASREPREERQHLQRVSFESPTTRARRCASPSAWRRCSCRRTSKTASCWPTRPISSCKGQLEEARRRLVEQEKKLQEFRSSNNGQLPDQVQSNLQLLQGAQTQLQSVTESSNRDRDRLLALDKTLAEMPPADHDRCRARVPVARGGQRSQRADDRGAAARGGARRAARAASCGSSPSTRTSAAPSASSPNSRRRPRPRRCSSRCPRSAARRRPTWSSIGSAARAPSRCAPRCQEIRQRLESRQAGGGAARRRPSPT